MMETIPMTIALPGIYPAFLTPLDSQHRFNPRVAEQLLQHLLSTDVHGVYVAGSTGEGLRLPVETRMALVETLMPMLPSSKKLIVHVGASQLDDVIKLADHAFLHGAHAISSLPPVGSAELVRVFYGRILKTSQLPLILYYFPKAVPSAFQDPQELIDVCEHPNVLGVKFTDFNFYLMQRLIKSGKQLFNGYDEVLAAGLLMGAQGGIGSTYNMMPEVYLKIYSAALQGDWEAARIWQSRSNSVLDILLRYPFFPALRAVMRYKGFDCGPLMSGENFASAGQHDQLIAELNREMPREIAELIQWPGIYDHK